LSIHDAVALDQVVYHLDEPVADLSTLGFNALSQLASESVTVALCGQGADELLGGYGRYQNARLVQAWGRIPLVRRPAAALLSRVSPRLARGVAVLNEPSADARLLRMSRLVPADLHYELRSGRSGDGAAEAITAATRGFDGSLVARAMLADSKLA